MHFDNEFPFWVEEWSEGGSVTRIHAKVSRLDIGYGAYAATLEAFPSRKLTLRNGIRVIKDSTRPDR